MAVAVNEMAPAELVALVNGWGTIPRAERGDAAEPYPATADVAGERGVPVGGNGVVTDKTDKALARAADRLHRVFATADAARQAQLITELLIDTAVRPVLRVEDDHPHAAWTVDDGSDAVLASAAVTLRQYLAEHGPGRIGVCTGRRCADVYVDHSPGGRRRFCSVTCQNRARVAAFRRRRAASGP